MPNISASMYLKTSFASSWWAESSLCSMRAGAARPGLQLLLAPISPTTVSRHMGTIMLLAVRYGRSFFSRLQLHRAVADRCSPDRRLPTRLKLLGVLVYLLLVLLVLGGFLTGPGGAGRLRLEPPINRWPTTRSPPGAGANMWFVGLVISPVLVPSGGYVNMINHDPAWRAPGMTMFRVCRSSPGTSSSPRCLLMVSRSWPPPAGRHGRPVLGGTSTTRYRLPASVPTPPSTKMVKFLQILSPGGSCPTGTNPA